MSWKVRNNMFFLPAIIILIICMIICFLFPRENIHILINGFHSDFMDKLFSIWTWLGDGVGALVVVLIFLIIKVRFGLILFGGYAISGLSAQLLKRLFFEEMARPVKYFELKTIDYNLYLISGVDYHSWYSFPSGHTATAFGLFFGLSLLLRQRAYQLVLLILALGVGYSRMYLSQHFLMDVTAGACIGLAGGYFGWWWLDRYNSNWINKPLFSLLFR